LTRTRTWSDESELDELAAKKRMCQSPGAKHIGGVVTELPAGIYSEWLSRASRTFQGSLPETTAAPRPSVHPGAPLSNEPPGTRT
jgi:hypothetical protein